MQNKFGTYLSDDLNSIQVDLINLMDILRSRGDSRLGESQARYLKLAIQFARRSKAEEQEELRSKTSHADIQKKIDDMMIPVNEFMESAWYKQTEAFRLPPVTEFLTLQEAYKGLPNQNNGTKTQFDEKFGILQSPSLFFPALRHARMEAALRNIEVAVLFVDIDDFKSFNTDFGETVVDRQILPIIMRTIEAHVYSHGAAFKFGGDEYVLLLPNMGEDMSTKFLYSLQDKLFALTIPKVERKITASIGCCIVSADSFLTDAEVLENANRAMRHAKKWKDCMGGFNGKDFEDKNLYQLGKHGVILTAN